MFSLATIRHNMIKDTPGHYTFVYLCMDMLLISFVHNYLFFFFFEMFL